MKVGQEMKLPSYSQRGLHYFSPDETSQNTPSQVQGFGPILPSQQGTSGEVVGASTPESTKESSSAHLVVMAEEWIMYSVWSAQVDKLTEGLVGRRIPMERDTFMDGLHAHIKPLFADYEARASSQDWLVLVVKGDFPDTHDPSRCEIEVAQVCFRMPKTKSNEKTRSNYLLRSHGDLGRMLWRTVRKLDVLVISGGTLIERENESLIVVNCPYMQGDCCIVRLRQREEETSSGEFILGESIEPIIHKDTAGWEEERRFKFTYVLSVRRGTVKVVRHRHCRSDKGEPSAPRSALDKHFFPITPADPLGSCVETLWFYNWNKDPTWPRGRFGPYVGNNVKRPRKPKQNTNEKKKVARKQFVVIQHRSSATYFEALVAVFLAFFLIVLCDTVLCVFHV